MKRFLLVIISLLYFLNVSSQIFEKRPSWRQEFKYRGKIDDTFWNCQKKQFNNYKEFYTDSINNIFVKNGKLHLRATSDKRGDRLCSSGRVNTLNKQSFLYGKLEIRAKVPTGKGIFPAIWMLRVDHPRKYPLGEIDIMEYIDCFEGNSFCTTSHIIEEPNNIEKKHSYTFTKEAEVLKYHIYGLEWTPEQLVFTLDHKEFYRLKKEDVECWPFDSPYYLILNVAFGNWGAKCGLDENIFPKEMVIDWIRYYKLKSSF